MLNGLTNTFIREEWRQDAPMMWLQRSVAETLAWRAVPIVLAVLWMRYLRRHDWTGTISHIVMVTISILIGYFFYRLMVRTFKDDSERLVHTNSALVRPKIVTRLITFLIPAVLLYYSYGAIHTIPEYRVKNGRFIVDADNTEGIIIAKDRLTSIDNLSDYCRLSVTSVFDMFGYRPFADLSQADVSFRPSGWTGEKPLDFALVKGAFMSHVDLHYAWCVNAFLVKADLTGADLDGAMLVGADLREANLSDSKLNAILALAHMERTVLTDANMEGADMTGVFLDGATGPECVKGLETKSASFFM